MSLLRLLPLSKITVGFSILLSQQPEYFAEMMCRWFMLCNDLTIYLHFVWSLDIHPEDENYDFSEIWTAYIFPG